MFISFTCSHDEIPSDPRDYDTSRSNTDIDKDITDTIFRAFSIVEEMGGSHKNFLNIVFYGRDLCCKSNRDAMN